MTVPANMMRAFYGASKKAGLDDDSRRDLMERETGKRSAKALTRAEMARVLNVLNNRTGHKPGPKQTLQDTPHVRKLRALWLSGWNLGVVRDETDSALAAFVKRQTGVDAMRWLAPEHASKAIDALKDWLARDAGVDWPKSNESAHAHRIAVVEAQWGRLCQLKAVRIDNIFGLAPYCGRVLDWPNVRGHQAMTDKEADLVIKALGRKLRKALARQAGERAHGGV